MPKKIIQMENEKHRIEKVYHGYSENKQKSWRGNIAKQIAWNNIFSIIKKECSPSQNGNGGLKILEIGCSYGNILKKFSNVFQEAKLFGIDIRKSPLYQGKQNHPDIYFQCCDACHLPVKEQKFDLVFQFVCLSSILAPHLRKQVLSEMKRVLKNGGLLISLDMRYWSPNRHVAAIFRKEVKGNLEDFSSVVFFPVWLLPPLQRVLKNQILIKLLSGIDFLCSHWLCIARK